MIVYITINLINNKIYVGQYRGKRKSYLGSGTWLKRAIQKYGKENFRRETLEECTIDNINEREKFWIKELDSRNPNVGYNILEGGDVNPVMKGADHPNFGKHLQEQTRRKISNSLIGKYQTFKNKNHSTESKNKISQSRIGKYRGENNPFYGKTHSKEFINKLIERNKKNFQGENNPMFGKKHTEETKAKIRALKIQRDLLKKEVLNENYSNHTNII